MPTLIQVLMSRDSMTEAEAKADIASCREEMLAALAQGDTLQAEEIYEDWFGLEPDYLFDLI